ncbi:hypothetical protein D3C80_523710 [compost metagenome]
MAVTHLPVASRQVQANGIAGHMGHRVFKLDTLAAFANHYCQLDFPVEGVRLDRIAHRLARTRQRGGGLEEEQWVEVLLSKVGHLHVYTHVIPVVRAGHNYLRRELQGGEEVIVLWVDFEGANRMDAFQQLQG